MHDEDLLGAEGFVEVDFYGEGEAALVIDHILRPHCQNTFILNYSIPQHVKLSIFSSQSILKHLMTFIMVSRINISFYRLRLPVKLNLDQKFKRTFALRVNIIRELHVEVYLRAG